MQVTGSVDLTDRSGLSEDCITVSKARSVGPHLPDHAVPIAASSPHKAPDSTAGLLDPSGAIEDDKAAEARFSGVTYRGQYRQQNSAPHKRSRSCRSGSSFSASSSKTANTVMPTSAQPTSELPRELHDGPSSRKYAKTAAAVPADDSAAPQPLAAVPVETINTLLTGLPSPPASMPSVGDPVEGLDHEARHRWWLSRITMPESSAQLTYDMTGSTRSKKLNIVREYMRDWDWSMSVEKMAQHIVKEVSNTASLAALTLNERRRGTQRRRFELSGYPSPASFQDIWTD